MNEGIGFALARRDAWLVARFAQPARVLSWAMIGGGLHTTTRGVAWLQVRDAELAPPVDPVQLFTERLRAADLEGCVGLMTGRDLDSREDRTARIAGAVARCVATVGLGNALRAGDPPGSGPPVGTINLMCWIDRPLSEAAMLEALSIAIEARTAAVIDAGAKSTRTGAAATGTGTDCAVIACPDGDGGDAYCGKHTAAGSAIGAAVFTAVYDGAVAWLATRDTNGP